jgi:Domain of unknown function (DUF222)
MPPIAGAGTILSEGRSSLERMNETPYRPLPAGLTELTPGPALSAALALVDRATCTGFQLLEVMQARHRQVCWEQAQLLTDLHELAHVPDPASGAPSRRSPGRRTQAAEEVSFALSVTKRAAAQDLALAFSLFNGFESIHAALAAGRIDVPKAKMILREVSRLGPERAAGAVDTILSTVDYRSYAEIRDSLRRLVLTIDPALARRRQQNALQRRNVQRTEHASGTASITARNLPVEAVAAVFDHLDRLTTAAAQARSAPDTADPAVPEPDSRTPNQIRTDIFLDLLRGTAPDKVVASDEAGSDHQLTKCSPDRRPDHAGTPQAPRRTARVRGGRRRHRSEARRHDEEIAALIASDRQKATG